jgi:hypothetical protein
MSDLSTCPACGWDPRGSDRFHRCHGQAWAEVLRPNTKVAGPARGGGEIEGVVLETQNGPGGLTVLVKWNGHVSGRWTPPGRLRLVTQDEAA